VPNLVFRRHDLLETSLVDASTVIVYLYRAGIRSLKPKLEQELKPGVWILSNTFAFPEWKPLRIVNTGDLNQTKIYVYKTGDLEADHSSELRG